MYIFVYRTRFRLQTAHGLKLISLAIGVPQPFAGADFVLSCFLDLQLNWHGTGCTILNKKSLILGAATTSATQRRLGRRKRAKARLDFWLDRKGLCHQPYPGSSHPFLPSLPRRSLPSQDQERDGVCQEVPWKCAYCSVW